MGRLKTIARRTFLIGSAAIVGGVAFGTYMYKRPFENPLLAHLEEGETAITPYVKIDAEGITLITPRTDLGQGAYSMQAMLIAEELDVTLDQVNVDPGLPSPAYYNTALSQESPMFPPSDESAIAEASRNVTDALMKFLGLQVTGGSTSVPDAYEKLRTAGAVARETLKLAASQKSGIAVADLKTENANVVLPDGKTLSYVELAPAAATLDPVTDIELRDPAQWKLIGKPVQRMDIAAKSTGTQRYGIDFRTEGMVFATVKLNPRQGGAMKSYDASAAEKMRGVKKIVPIKGGLGIVADNTWRAFQAAEAIEVDWDAAPFPAEMDDHWQALADSFTPDSVDAVQRDDGDVETALAGGTVIAGEYRAPYLAHAPLEPISATVKVTDDRADVWTSTQIPRFVQGNVAKLTGLDDEQVFVHVLYAGGSFGHRLEDEVVKQATEIAIAMKGVPVHLTYSREEDMIHDFPRQIAMSRFKGTVKDGKVEALDLGIAMPSVMGSQLGRQNLAMPGPDPMITAGAWEQPLSIPHYRVTGYRAPDLAPISSWRAVGASSNGFFHETALDELIHAAGADPMAERIRLTSHEPSRKVLEAVAEMSNWGSDLGPKRGRGVAIVTSFGVPVAEVVEVTDTEDGIKIDRVFVAAEVGRVVDPINFDNLVKGGVVWGLGHAMNCEITYSDGMAEQNNYDTFTGMRFNQCPIIEVRGLENGSKVRGIGEPPVPPAAPALGNAIFAATGKRIREMPFNKHVDFV
ncbi:molybdopterin cofactor-binding domain-containing protein [Pseudahrensia aquimaris]|uniref:Molybdopterin cofactor-binding domain-containing protein n=1 Tax=Pseudahrensia aquimaris TaxID=744461 RepID=A0ABW3FID8_9HYPH